MHTHYLLIANYSLLIVNCIRVVYCFDLKVQKFSILSFVIQSQNRNGNTTQQKQNTDETQKKSIVYVNPIRNTHKVYLEWELPKIFVKDKSKTAELLAYALNRGQRYSLKQILKSDNLIDDLSVDIEKIGNHHLLFQVSVELSEKGIQDVDSVIKSCFEAITSAKSAICFKTMPCLIT